MSKMSYGTSVLMQTGMAGHLKVPTMQVVQSRRGGRFGLYTEESRGYMSSPDD